jgi:hypothetical protein
MHVPTLLLGDMSLRAMHGLHVFPEGAGVCVTLGAAWDFAHVGFLPNATRMRQKMVMKVIMSQSLAPQSSHF